MEEEGSMIKILIVDDEADTCDFVKNFFEARGFRVFIALNGLDGLKIVKDEHPSIALLDIKMKGIDGIETLERIRKIDKKIKTVMVTAVNDEGKMKAARKFGCKDYITKPLVLENLEATVKKCAKECNNE